MSQLAEGDAHETDLWKRWENVKLFHGTVCERESRCFAHSVIFWGVFCGLRHSRSSPVNGGWVELWIILMLPCLSCSCTQGNTGSHFTPLTRKCLRETAKKLFSAYSFFYFFFYIWAIFIGHLKLSEFNMSCHKNVLTSWLTPDWIFIFSVPCCQFGRFYFGSHAHPCPRVAEVRTRARTRTHGCCFLPALYVTFAVCKYGVRPFVKGVNRMTRLHLVARVCVRC